MKIDILTIKIDVIKIFLIYRVIGFGDGLLFPTVFVSVLNVFGLFFLAIDLAATTIQMWVVWATRVIFLGAEFLFVAKPEASIAL